MMVNSLALRKANEMKMSCTCASICENGNVDSDNGMSSTSSSRSDREAKVGVLSNDSDTWLIKVFMLLERCFLEFTSGSDSGFQNRSGPNTTGVELRVDETLTEPLSCSIFSKYVSLTFLSFVPFFATSSLPQSTICESANGGIHSASPRAIHASPEFRNSSHSSISSPTSVMGGRPLYLIPLNLAGEDDVDENERRSVVCTDLDLGEERDDELDGSVGKPVDPLTF
ncbi:hypothetical protein OGAPHI_002668 [Ogataea philodendri]|uniref:Uncharacterized protein n=1 Tax=Ogataea philodendri TaxID=1378263 RepID=A0A9P8T794_9ASCO|nr:uncharacterized protein OGAPHI_002668 [Ogataea philodendri]KAH3668913.1 hypothetical protein OGAPHI_002668 [Ogataea philodendri]